MKNILHILILLPLLSSCLLEYPELTSDGETGVDPTSVALKVNITSDFRMDGDDVDYSHATIDYRHRITVAAFLDRQLVSTRTIFEGLSENGIVRTSVNLDLHAKEYQIVVWADVTADAADPYYEISDLSNILYKGSYRGQTVYKDALCASETADLSGYKNEWGARASLDVELSRPLGKYEIVATDVEKFLSLHSPSKDNTYEVRVNYNGYVPAGYNALDGITKNAFNYMTYSRSISGITAGTQEFSMAFDYIFMDGEEAVVPVTVEVRDSKLNVVSKNNIDINLTRNAKTVIKGNFLGTMPGDGIGIDTEFDKKDDIDLGVI